MDPTPGAQTAALLQAVRRFAKKKKVALYIVGGFLRDAFLKRKKENPDIDFAVEQGAIGFGRALSRELKAGFVVLDEEHGCCRLVKKTDQGVCTLDFSDFRGKPLAEDLRLRDFTINAFAVELGRFLGAGPRAPKNISALASLVIDPYGGRKDLASGVVRMVDARAFDDDPLRVLRAFSLSALFGFRIEKKTLRAACQKKEKLSGVSFERIRDELFKILSCDSAFAILSRLDKLGILRLIIPEIEVMRKVKQGPYHHLDVLEHSLEAVRQFEGLLRELKNRKDIRQYLNEVFSGDRKRSALLKLGVLLHDIGKPQAKRRREGKTLFHGHERIGREFAGAIAERLRLSNDEKEALKTHVFWHLRPGYLADNEAVTPRAQFRYFRDTGREGASVLLLSIADQRATKGPLTSEASRQQHERVVLRLLAEYFRRSKEKIVPRLITGDDVMREFSLAPSPLIGKVLAHLEELQAIGKITTRAQALREAAKVIRAR